MPSKKKSNGTEPQAIPDASASPSPSPSASASDTQPPSELSVQPKRGRGRPAKRLQDLPYVGPTQDKFKEVVAWLLRDSKNVDFVADLIQRLK